MKTERLKPECMLYLPTDAREYHCVCFVIKTSKVAPIGHATPHHITHPTGQGANTDNKHTRTCNCFTFNFHFSLGHQCFDSLFR
jgi:hypothetical protein